MRRGARRRAGPPPRRHAPAPAAAATPASDPLPASADVVVIGAGLGGLSAAALLAKWGLSVAVLEGHTTIGGAAHAFTRPARGGGEYTFESGEEGKGWRRARVAAAHAPRRRPRLFQAPPSSPACGPPGGTPPPGPRGGGGGGRWGGGAARGGGRARARPDPDSNATPPSTPPQIDYHEYDSWRVTLPGTAPITAGVGGAGFDSLLAACAPGPAAAADWARVRAAMVPLAAAATAVPALALRGDAGAVVTVAARYLPSLAAAAASLPRMQASTASLLDDLAIPDPSFVRRWLDLLCFLLCGLPASGCSLAESSFMMREWYRPGAVLEFPVGGASAIAGALAGAVRRGGGTVSTRARASSLVLDPAGRAAGVRLADGTVVRARKAVISGASAAATAALAAAGEGAGSAAARALSAAAAATPPLASFMHYHCGFDADGLEGLDMHHLAVASWDAAGGVAAPQNVSLVSIASVADPSLAPPGRHCLHAYYPASEPWEIWEGVARGSAAYEELKAERSAPLRAACAAAVPGLADRVDLELVGTPLTHARFLNRDKGSYGPGWPAGRGAPGWRTPVPGLFAAGDYAFPATPGVPSAAASGAAAAASVAGVRAQWRLLNELGI